VLVVETRGSAYERGRQYGEQLADHIRRRAPAHPLQPITGRGERDLVAANMLRYLDRHEPALVDEVRGVAAGAGIGFEAAFHFNASSPVHYVTDYQAAVDAGRASDGCTNVAFASTDRGPLLGKTNDGGAPVPPEKQASTWVLQHAHPDAGPEFFLLAPVGALSGVAGMNADGFAVGQSAAQVVRGQSGSGVPNNLILKPLLERCQTVAGALDVLESRDLAGKGLNLMLLDSAGTVRAAEKSAGLLGVREPDDTGLLYFSNHCHTDGLRDLPPRHDRANSLRRWALLERLFDRDGGYASRDEATMRETITTHGEGGICQHGPDMFTSLGILIAPRERLMWTSDGAPCSAQFVAHTLSPTLAAAI
jgi:isopenicillin-N N-acyltransferase like protein